MFNNHFEELPDAKYDDIKIEIKSIWDTFSLARYLQTYCEWLVYIFQIYCFANSDDFEAKLFVYVLGSISLRFLFSFMAFIRVIISQNINNCFFMKNYYGIGDLFKKAILVAECANLVVYFPFKYLIQFMFKGFILDNGAFEKILMTSSEVSKAKLSSFLTLNFYALLMQTTSVILGDILFIFKMNSVLNLNSIIRVVINVTFCRFFNKKSKDDYFMNGIAYANIITELFSLIFLICLQHIKNPYPQAWVQFDLQIFNINTFYSIFDLFQLRSFFTFELLEYWDDLFLLIYSCIYLTKNSVHTLLFLYTLMLFKRFYFYMRRNVKEEIVEYYNQIQENHSSSMLNTLSYEYDSPNQGIKSSYQWILFIKTKVMGTIAINLVLGIVFLLAYCFGGFASINQSTTGWWYIVPFYALNGIVEQCTNQIKGIREYLLKKESLKLILIAFGISYLCFVLVKIFIGDNLFMLIIGIYSGYYFLLYSFYPEIKNVDMRIVNLEILINNNSNETPYLI